MKARKMVLIMGAALLSLAVNQTIHADDLTAEAVAASLIIKGPVLASPHALEEFPSLTRAGLAQPMRAELVPASVKSNGALVQSPRVLEAYPILARGPQMPRHREPAELTRARQNAALANSPREREEFPLLRNGPPSRVEGVVFTNGQR